LYVSEAHATYFFPNTVDPSPRNLFHRSGSPEKRDTTAQGYITCEANRYLVSIDHDRDLHLSAGAGEHFLEFFRVFIYVDVGGPIPIGCPSLVAERSAVGSVNNNFTGH